MTELVEKAEGRGEGRLRAVLELPRRRGRPHARRPGVRGRQRRERRLSRSASAPRRRRSAPRSRPGCRPGDLEAIGITASPCGGCRQWLHEFRIDEVSYRREDGTIRHHHLRAAASGHAGTCPHEVRLRGPRRPAERRQVDARERAHRREGRDRLAASRTRRATGSAASGRRRTRSSCSSTCPAGRSRSTRSPSGCRAASRRRSPRTSTSSSSSLNARERIGAGDRYVARRVFDLGCPVVIALNKVDRLKAGHIAEQMKTAAGLGDFHALHPVSARTGDGIDELRADLVSLLPEGPMLYPDGEVTDMPLEARIAELVREQALTSPARRCRTRSPPRWSRSTRAASTSGSTPRPRARSRS